MEAPQAFSESVRKKAGAAAGNSARMGVGRDLSERMVTFFCPIIPPDRVLQSLRRARISKRMAKSPMPLAGLCVLYLAGMGCSSDHDPKVSSSAGAPGASAGAAGAAAQPEGGRASAGAASGTNRGGTAGAGAAGGSTDSAGAAGSAQSGAGGRAGPPPAVDGKSVYSLECHGDSKDCNLASVPCFGVSSQTPNVAAGWACANRCSSDAECSSAASGAEAAASCVAFASTGHCMLVCQNENRTASCPDGMACYVPPKSPIGYCLWQ